MVIIKGDTRGLDNDSYCGICVLQRKTTYQVLLMLDLETPKTVFLKGSALLMRHLHN